MNTGLLKNKIKYIINQNKCNASATILVLFKVGSRNEPKNYYGISHYIEHMMFKGTKKRPNNKAIVDNIFQYGGKINAYTGKDETGYYVSIPSQHLDVAMDVLSDILFNSQFPELNVEKDIVIHELERHDSNPDRKIYELNDEITYQGTPLQHSISGTKVDIKKFNKQMMLNYLSKYYCFDNMVICVSGNTQKNIVSQLNNYFGKQQFKYKSTTVLPNTLTCLDFMDLQTIPRLNQTIFKNISQTYICISLPTYSYHNPKSYIVELIGTLLAGNMGSRLFIKLREEKGLVYSIKHAVDRYEDMGSLKIIFSTNNNRKKIDQCCLEIIDEFENLKKHKITQKELNYNKDYMIGNLILSQEDTKSMATFLAQSYLFMNKKFTHNDLIKIYRKITINDVYKISNEIFDKNKLNISVVSRENII